MGLGMLAKVSERLVPGAGPSRIANIEFIHRTVIIR